MPAIERIPVTPAVLVWARESISLSKAVAARRLGVSEETLDRWESGELNPTITQLRAMADKYKRPLGVMLLREPPRTFDAMRDFRKSPILDSPWSPELHGEFRRALEQREVFQELEEISPGSLPRTSRPPRISKGGDVESAGYSLRSYLGVSSSQQNRWQNPYEALNSWSGAVESKGIIVIHTRNIPVDEMRGFSIGEWPFPVIALNGGDFPRARSFTLLHELVHLSIRLGGLCDLHDEGNRNTSGDELEHYCNQVAAAVLVPKDSLMADVRVTRATSSYDWTLTELAVIASRFQVSSEALLLRLVSLGKANWATYNRRKPELQAEYDSALQQIRLRRQQGQGGANFYRTKARDIGHSYANTVLDAFGNRAISARDVADFLDIKYGQLSSLQAELR